MQNKEVHARIGTVAESLEFYFALLEKEKPRIPSKEIWTVTPVQTNSGIQQIGKPSLDMLVSCIVVFDTIEPAATIEKI